MENPDPETILLIIFDGQEVIDEALEEIREIWDRTALVCRFFRQIEVKSEDRALLPKKWTLETELQEIHCAKFHPDHIPIKF